MTEKGILSENIQLFFWSKNDVLNVAMYNYKLLKTVGFLALCVMLPGWWRHSYSLSRNITLLTQMAHSYQHGTTQFSHPLRHPARNRTGWPIAMNSNIEHANQHHRGQLTVKAHDNKHMASNLHRQTYHTSQHTFSLQLNTQQKPTFEPMRVKSGQRDFWSILRFCHIQHQYYPADVLSASGNVYVSAKSYVWKFTF